MWIQFTEIRLSEQSGLSGISLNCLEVWESLRIVWNEFLHSPKTDEAFSLLMKSMIWKDFMVVYISESRILVYMIEAKFAIRKKPAFVLFCVCTIQYLPSNFFRRKATLGVCLWSIPEAFPQILFYCLWNLSEHYEIESIDFSSCVSKTLYMYLLANVFVMLRF